jgi:hypothetical protein
MTQEDVVRRIISQKGCHNVSCLGRSASWQGVECPFNAEDDGCGGSDEIVSKAKAWMDKRGLLPYSSTFTIAHRFKPGDRVRHKHDTAGPVTTVAEVVFTADCGAFYRFAETGAPNGSISYCDKNLRLADCDNEAEKPKEMP